MLSHYTCIPWIAAFFLVALAQPPCEFPKWTRCRGVCRPPGFLHANPTDCGACGRSCSLQGTGPGPYCSQGQCGCRIGKGIFFPGYTLCFVSKKIQTCQDVSSSAQHCGSCNRACAADQTCRGGVCTSPAVCPPPPCGEVGQNCCKNSTCTGNRTTCVSSELGLGAPGICVRCGQFGDFCCPDPDFLDQCDEETFCCNLSPGDLNVTTLPKRCLPAMKTDKGGRDICNCTTCSYR